jgi:hypothetical protein
MDVASFMGAEVKEEIGVGRSMVGARLGWERQAGRRARVKRRRGEAEQKSVMRISAFLVPGVVYQTLQEGKHLVKSKILDTLLHPTPGMEHLILLLAVFR